MKKRTRDELCEIKKYKVPHTFVNPIINLYQIYLDVAYISVVIKPLEKAEVLIAVLSYRPQSHKSVFLLVHKVWPAKQRAIVELLVIGLNHTPSYLETLDRENRRVVIV